MKGSAASAVLAWMLMIGATPAMGQDVPNLTGTWTGRWSCRSFDGAKFIDKDRDSTLTITQSGTTLMAHINGPPMFFFYNGAIIPDGKRPAERGEALLNQCGTDNLPLAGDESEILRATVKTKTGATKASFTAISIYENTGEFGPSAGTCRYNYKRVDTADPQVAGCPS